MSEVLQSFKRGSWAAHVVKARHLPQLTVRLDHPDGYRTDWPIQYDNSKIGYDMWNAPRDAQRATRAAFKWIGENENQEVIS